MDRAKALDKIKKCLRLAKSSNPHEAAAALRQAQTLAREYAVSDAELAAIEAGESRVKSSAARSPVDWEVGLVSMVARCFGCEPIYLNGEAAYALLGIGANHVICSYACAVLLRQARRARSEYIATRLTRCGLTSKRRRADEFCRGWVTAVRGKAEALVVSDADAKTLQAYKGVHYPVLSEHAGRDGARSRSDRWVGYVEGDKARLDRGVGAAAPLAIGAKP